MRARFPRAVVDNGYVLAGTLSGLLGRHGFDGRPLDLLKIDIDSFDCHVVAAALRAARPAIVVMEVNVKYDRIRPVPQTKRTLIQILRRIRSQGKHWLTAYADDQCQTHVSGNQLAVSV